MRRKLHKHFLQSFDHRLARTAYWKLIDNLKILRENFLSNPSQGLLFSQPWWQLDDHILFGWPREPLLCCSVSILFFFLFFYRHSISFPKCPIPDIELIRAPLIIKKPPYAIGIRLVICSKIIIVYQIRISLNCNVYLASIILISVLILLQTHQISIQGLTLQ